MGEPFGNPDDLENLLRRSRNGDHDAFVKLFELKRSQLATEATRKLGPQLQRRIDASDVLQEVFLEANRRLEELAETDVPLVAWLRILLRQKVIDFQRMHLGASKRAMSMERSLEYRVADVDSIARQLIAVLTSPSIKAQRNELHQRIKTVLDELSIVDRQVLVLRHFESKSNREVAESLGLSINAASNRYVRALKRFKTVLDASDEDWTQA
ncbi:MAG: sigma-70 family RNA polymerase sigma factor [Planctomycetota bacterium]